MAGIHQGISNIFTGEGGAPGFDGLTDEQKSKMIQDQIGYGMQTKDLLGQWQGNVGQSYQAQQNLLPLVYQQLGITPTYGDNGQIIGYQNTPTAGTYAYMQI